MAYDRRGRRRAALRDADAPVLAALAASGACRRWLHAEVRERFGRDWWRNSADRFAALRRSSRLAVPSRASRRPRWRACALVAAV